MSWFPGMTRSGRFERAQELRRTLLLLTAVPMSQIPSGENDLRVGGPNERNQVGLHLRLLVRSRVKVGNVQHTERRHRAGRL